MFIEFSGSAAEVKRAFGISLHSYVVNGEQHWANASERVCFIGATTEQRVATAPMGRRSTDLR